MSCRSAISVIIPTLNRKEVLLETLQALEKQTLPASQFEVIVIDDGSTDGTYVDISRLNFSFKLRIYRQDSRGAAAARNSGANYAEGGILLFLDSDMIASPHLLAQHMWGHQQHKPALVIGRREELDNWVGSFLVSPDSISSTDWRFFQNLMTFQDALSCNLSIEASHWRNLSGFDEQFPSSGYEDVEFAYRAALAGFEIIPNYHAVAYHNHPMTVQQYFYQVRSYQRSAALLFKKHPELHGQIEHLKDKEPINLRQDSIDLIFRKLLRRLLSLQPVLRMLERTYMFLEHSISAQAVKRFFLRKILGSYQLLGLREGIKKYGW